MFSFHYKPQRIFLIGFMCSGKSTVGKRLAQVLELPFIDIDRAIEKRVGPLVKFFVEHGEAQFRIEESSELTAILSGADAVIATGGGTPCVLDNMKRMNADGITIWLDMPLDYLLPIIEKKGGDRPLLLGLKGEALTDRVTELLAEREHFYSKADLIVQADATPEIVVERIVKLIDLTKNAGV